MMRILSLNEIIADHRPQIGGKMYSLAMLRQRGFRVPDAVCVPADVYNDYCATTGIRENILLELHRKKFADMRWEEIWDVSLRIRNLFLRKTLSGNLHRELHEYFTKRFGRRPVAVRSSAPDEDTSTSSFAGLHESFVNICGPEAILEHILKVWASLWSDGALLYRQELGLHISTSAMAVVVQEMIVGERSGVVFSRSPVNSQLAVIESVYGLNQGHVDGSVEPDRWLVGRDTGIIESHHLAERQHRLVSNATGTRMEPLPLDLARQPPLAEKDIRKIFELALQLEDVFHAPQDVEWTMVGDEIYLLQARPVTATGEDHQNGGQDQRSWYLSLRRSFENLKKLRHRIEGELIPAMLREAAELGGIDCVNLSDGELSREIERRYAIHDNWIKTYWAEFIPFAHGVRLFGQLYNDVMRPPDPYAFMALLGATKMASLQRNRMLEEMAAHIRRDQSLVPLLKQRLWNDMPADFKELFDAYMKQFGMLQSNYSGNNDIPADESRTVIHVVLEMAAHPPVGKTASSKDTRTLHEQFLSRFAGEKRIEAEELLDLARASYRLRDDDNIHLARIGACYTTALNEGSKRLAARGKALAANRDEVIQALRDPEYMPVGKQIKTTTEEIFSIKARQLIGQPAGPGVARGKARVIDRTADLGGFKYGEILVCDAVDPTMTFIIPLASAIVERRGGMLIHGAIIAREYGLPCVTGIPQATSSIMTGDLVTVDGYLGIVTIGETSAA
jgi:phosphohistidine swiveling domain-containing protein